MKLKLLTLLGCIMLASQLFSQTTSIDLNIANKSIVDVFGEIQEKSGYRFFYSDDAIDLTTTVTINVSNAGIEKVVEELESQTNLTFRLMEDQLIVVVPAGAAQQSAVITGKVTSPIETEGVPGVNVVVKGTTTGVVTDIDGNFAIEVPDKYVVLQFSFIGFETQDVPVTGRDVVHVVLLENVEAIDEVVVTALSIQRNKESLGYSISQVSGEELTRVKENNVMNNLAGKVAGLRITKNPSGVDGSTRIVLRGVSSLKGSNRPLVVVDGIPISSGSYGGGSHIDMGDALSDINPEDVESMSVLKGAGAAAAYGSRGGNGVILITTKSGQAKKGFGVSLATSYTVEQPYLYPEMQNEYGQGAFGVYPADMGSAKGADGWSWSWGPKMEIDAETGEYPLVDSHIEEGDGFKQLRYEPNSNPYDGFYQNGNSLINTVAFTGGNAQSNFRASITNQNSEGIVPNNTLAKQTLNMRGFSNMGDKVELDGKVTYVHHMAKNRPNISEDNASAAFAFNNMPRNVSLETLRNYTTDNENKQIWSWDRTSGNPYWNLDNKKNWDERHRLQTLMSVKFNFTEKFSFLMRSGFDFTNRITKRYANYGSANLNNFEGEYHHNWGNSLEWNTDGLLGYKTDLSDDFKINVNLGGNYRYQQGKGISQNGFGWQVPNFYHISNLEKDNVNTGEGFSEKEVWSAYVLGNISWRNYVYLDVTLRNDVTSTIPTRDNSNSYFYHSENLSILFSELLDLKSDIFSGGKIRGSYAVVGNDLGPYQTNNYYGVGSSLLPYPIGHIGGDLAFYDLKPEMTYSWEVGTNLEFFNNRMAVDLTYYTARTENQLMNVQLSPATGYNNRKYNAGEVMNSGIELQLSGSPVSSVSGFNWDVTLTLSRNQSEVVSLSGDEEFIPLGGVPMGFIHVQARAGEPFGQIYGYDYARDDKGRIQVDANGFPLAADEMSALGNLNPDLMGGINNSFKYKNLSLSFLIDGQLGGEYYSHSALYRDLFGTGVSSLEGRDEWYSTHGGSLNGQPIPGVFPDGYIQDGVLEGTDQVNTTPIDPFQRVIAVLGLGLGESKHRVPVDYIVDATNIRLREASLAYALPARWLDKTFIDKANVSVVGRNLLFLYNAAKDLDPESGINNQRIGPAIEQNAMPGTRNYGFNVNLSF